MIPKRAREGRMVGMATKHKSQEEKEIDAAKASFMAEFVALLKKYDVSFEYAACYYAGESPDMTLIIDSNNTRWPVPKSPPFGHAQRNFRKDIDMDTSNPDIEDFELMAKRLADDTVLE